jgi:hypothetical protein
MKAKRPRVVPSLGRKLKIVAEYEAGIQSVNIRHQHGISLIGPRTTVADTQKYKGVIKLSVPGTIKCLRTRENILLKLEKIFLVGISDQQCKRIT